MASKGASNHFGNARGSNKGHATEHIGYAWAKDFNKKTLKKHFNDHGKEMGYIDINSYKAAAIHFANYIDRENCVSVVDKKGTTFKFNKVTNEFAMIDKKGCVITYYLLDGGYERFLKVVEKECAK